MIVVPSVDEDGTASEELPQLVQDVHAPLSLNHSERRLCLPTETHLAGLEDRNTEAAFPIHETDHPLLVSWPFLLIVCTRHVFTAFPRARSDE